MVFLLIFLLIILSIITLRIKIDFTNIEFTTQYKKYFNKEYQIKFTIYIFKIIPILKIKVNNEKLQKILKNKNVMKVVEKEKIKVFENKKDIDKEIIKSVKNIKLQTNAINLKIQIGTQDAALTAIIIPVISTFIAILLRNTIKRYNNNQSFEIQPLYRDKNLINIEFSGIFEIKMIHIINTICILSKKRKGDKNERTSHRGSYDYGYE